jgi:DNA-binding NtrC family response regulator
MPMNKKVIIVEDEFIVADDLRLTLEEAGNIVSGIASSVEAARVLVRLHNPGMALLDIHLKGKLTGIDFAGELKEQGIPFIFLSAYSNQTILEAAKATQPYGFLVKPFRDKDVLVAMDIARYRHENSLETALRRENQLMSSLAEIDKDESEPGQRLLKIVKKLQSHIPFDYLTIGKKVTGDIPYEGISFLRLGMEEYQTMGMQELLTVTGLKMDSFKKILRESIAEKKPNWYNGDDFKKLRLTNPFRDLIARTFDLESNLTISFMDLNGNECYFSFYSRNEHAYHNEHLALLSRIYNMLITATGYISLQEKKKLSEHPGISGFIDIIGSDPELLNVLDQASQVAPFDTSVLIQGETGTGKEKVASCIHELSSRFSKPFIKINCAVLPPTLVESELFGHEKGSFTGASEKRIGKFEQADGGTIFLDEIGEMPLDMQAKLLRVLQEHVIERVGGKMPIAVNVRVIAATNRVLEKEVAEGRFRMDLYYRLNVFPLMLPPLRERKDDIHQLANYFANKFYKKVNKAFHGISAWMLVTLVAYDWPGNIRELENVIEQSVILNDGLSALELKRALGNSSSGARRPAFQTDGRPQNLDDIKKIQSETEKEYIVSVLRKSNGKIRGHHGAAEILNLPASTLESKISKLGIKKEDYA